MNKKAYGFTLTELLIVIIVIGILATIAVVSYQGITARANDAVVASDLRSNLQRIHLFSIHNGRQYYLSTKGGGMVDVSTDFNEASLFPV